MVEFQEDGSLLCFYLAIIQPQEQCLMHDRNSTAILEGREGGKEDRKKGLRRRDFSPLQLPTQPQCGELVALQ